MKIALLVLCFWCLPVFSFGQANPQLAISKSPLTSDEITIYREFLLSYTHGSKTTLNVSDVTDPFSPSDSDVKGCLKALGPITPKHIVHRFSTEFSGLSNIRLVNVPTHKFADPGQAIRRGDSVDHAVKAGFRAGVLSFSEIRFDAKHRLAAFSYNFHCGALCGHGGVVIFELRNGHWEGSSLRCDSWIS